MLLGHIVVKIMKPKREIETPRAGSTFKQERDVIALIPGLARWAAPGPFVPIVETDHSGNLFNDTGDQPHNSSGGVTRSRQQPHIKITPTHQLRYVASGHRQRPDVVEDARSVELVQQAGGLFTQRRLPGCKLLVGDRCLHDG